MLDKIKSIFKNNKISILILSFVIFTAASYPTEFSDGPINLGEWVLWNKVNTLMTGTIETYPDTALVVTPLITPENQGFKEALTGNDYDLPAATKVELSVLDSRDSHVNDFYISWGENAIADSLIFVLRFHRTTDVTEVYWPDLDPFSTGIDSVMYVLVDEPAYGGVVIPMIDKYGTRLSPPYYSLSIENTDASTAINDLEIEWRGRRLW